jgi:nucleoside-specific outer membrane channel protein Tsx
MPSIHYNRLLVTLFLCTASFSLKALDWTSNSLQYLHGSGYLLGAHDRDIITLEHSNGWQYGQHFLFIDTTHQHIDTNAWEAYGEAYSYLSGGKITGMDLSIGPIKDIGITLGINAGSQPTQTPFRAYLAGASVQFNWPIFKYIQIDCLAYKNAHLGSTSFQITPSWELPFQLAGIPLSFRGFMDYIGAGGSGAAQTVLFQPQLLVDAGHFIGHTQHLLVGLEYQYWHNKFGIDTIEESLPQAVAVLRF